MLDKTELQRKQIRWSMEKEGCWHPELANLYMGQKRSIQREISETLRKIPLRKIVEFLVKSGTADVAGAAYLVPNKIHDLLIHAAKRFDIVPQISMRVVEGWEGGDLVVDIAKEAQYKPHSFGSGGEIAHETVDTEKATLKPEAFGIVAEITDELIEDNQFDIIEWHIEQAGKAMGRYASDLALAVLKAAPDGDGTANAGATAGADTTLWTEVLTGVDGVGEDSFLANTMVVTPEAWHHSIVTEANATTRMPLDGLIPQPIAEGFDMKAQMLDTLFSTSPQLHDADDAAEAAFTTCVTLIFDRFNTLLTGRKRWLQLENYSEPIQDLAGVVISARQDSVTIFKDANYTLTEAEQ